MGWRTTLACCELCQKRVWWYPSPVQAHAVVRTLIGVRTIRMRAGRHDRLYWETVDTGRLRVTGQGTVCGQV